MPVTDLTGTTWVFNNTFPPHFPEKGEYYTEGDVRGLTPTSDYGYFIDFIWKDEYGEHNCNYIYNYNYDAGTTIGVATYPNGPEQYFNGSMTITGGTDATNSALISWLEANATQQAASTKPSVDLTTLSGWANLAPGNHTIKIVAKADGYRDSEPSASVSVTKAPTVVMPAKGDIITLDLKQYRVLKTEGTVAEVLCMYDANSSIVFDTSSNYNNTYAGKNIDTYCNNTFYNSLSSTMQNAIVAKTFQQDEWSRTSSVPTESHYTSKYGSSTYYLTLVNAAYGSSITRHCYCLSVQDVLDYLEATTSMGTSDTTLTDTNIFQMFWNVTTSQSGKYTWLRSASSSNSKYAFFVNGSYGSLGSNSASGGSAPRPAFQIDLSKISWSK